MSEAKQITIEDLNAHKERDDLWLLINGKVYDVTKFLDEVSRWPKKRFWPRAVVQLVA
jgi:hypothetical protein